MRYFVIRHYETKTPLEIVMGGDRLLAEEMLNNYACPNKLEIVEVAVIGDGARHSGKETI